MLSILIPVYNFDVRQLVSDLHRQCVREGIDFEIRCYDDGSTEAHRKANRSLGSFSGVVYRELPENLGRARIRNRLAEDARYGFLLFMDCDSGIVRDNYLRHYIDHLQAGTVLYGGRVYASAPPSDPRLLLHWRYGRSREQVPAARRAAEPYHGFMTNNFVVPREVMAALPFEDQLRHYGHEDTLFGLQLRKRQVPILHLENPLEHLDLETAESFLAKTRQAVTNLHLLYRRDPLIDTRLLRLFRRLKESSADRWAERVLRLTVPFLLGNLSGRRPSLRLLDLYKLWLLLWEDRSIVSEKL